MNAEVLHRDTEDTVMSSGDVVTPSNGEVMSSAMDTSGDGRANYDSIPAELKLKIWENVAMPSGVHYFHMQPSFRRQHTVTQQVLIQPWKPAASDTSAWRVRNAHKWTDEFAWDVLSKKLEGKADAVRQFWPRDDCILTHWQPVEKEYQVALVNLATDLVVFKCTGMFLHKHFIPMPEWQEFSGVTRVGMTFHNPTGPFPRRAFACACALQIHSRISLCPYLINSFMSFFRHLKTFYFVYKINGNTIKFKDPKANQGVSRTTLTRPYFNYFRGKLCSFFSLLLLR